MAMTFLNIFQHTTPLSAYLQTSSLDYLQAWRIVKCTLEHLHDARDKFIETYNAEKVYVSVMTEKIEQKSEKKFLLRGNCFWEQNFLQKDLGKEVLMFNSIVDQIVTSMKYRFLENQSLYLHLECLDPKRFDDLSNQTIELTRIAQLVPSCD